MKELENKVQKLIELSNQKVESGLYRVLKTMEMKTLIIEIRKLAKDEQTILGRIIRFPCDDQYSYYIITEINELTVTIECLDLYEGLVDKYHKEKSHIDRIQAECYIKGIDCILKIFPDEDILNVK